MLQKIEQVVRLIRSKGVGIYFITQAPSDIPDSVLSQLGNKVQHALRAHTPKVLGELATGEALVSFLDKEGRSYEGFWGA